MKIGMQSRHGGEWLLMLFSLPRAQASARVDIWRRLKRSGAVTLVGGGHLLPGSQDNRERFEWLAETIRKNRGDASILGVSAINGLPFEKIKALFVEARAADYSRLIEDAGNLKKDNNTEEIGALRLRRRFQDIAEIDFFGGRMKERAESALQRLSGRFRVGSAKSIQPLASKTRRFTNRVWVTRPRPGIDRCSSAWLIANFVDNKAKFTFAKTSSSVPDAIPFDMYESTGFGHIGDHCTFETLCQKFKLGTKPLRILAEMIHDADLKDEKYGRTEAITVDRILKGWSAAGIADDELLRKGMDLIDGLYRSIS